MGNTRKYPVRHTLSLAALSLTLSGAALAAKPNESDTAGAAGPADKSRFGSAGTVVLGMDGLVAVQQDRHVQEPYEFTTREGERVEVTSRKSSTFLSAFAPRLGADVFVTRHLSLGGAAGYMEATWTQDVRRAGGGTTSVSSTGRTLLLAPRLGFGLMSDSGLGLWARAKLNFQTQGVRGGLEDLAGEEPTEWSHELGVGLDALAVYAPHPNVVLSGGPFVGKRFYSYSERPASRAPEQLVSFGVTVGAGIVL
ncbi:MAG: hypothetical protein FJ104_03320 [Deltaproteobacteria bacterium]|nr:hypothetical protein [Deltaproteobacteria bacterium]